MKKYLRFFILFTGTLFFVWFFLPMCLFGVLNAGNIFGIFLCTIVTLYGVFFDKVNSAVLSFWKKGLGKAILCSFTLISLLLVVFTGSALIKMIKAADSPPSCETTVVVLGCMVYPSGPSMTMLTRLEATYDYLTKNPNLKCILSGGKGSDEPMSEAQAMRDWLVEHGIDENRLYMEDQSTSTFENLSFSKKLIEKEELCPEITVITNGFHQYRAKEIASSLSIESYSISGKTPIFLLPTYYLRELGGILAETLGLI